MLNVYLEGDRNGFNSKIAIEKFKASVKKNPDISVEELNNKYVKNDYELVLLQKTDNEYKYKINQKIVVNKTQELLKSKINLKRQTRTNIGLQKAKNNNVPEEIIKEYMKLKKVSSIPVPEPSEILENPEQYKSVLSLILGNDIMKKYGSNHPYVKYFKLLAKEIGVDEPLPFPTQNFLPSEIPQNMKQLFKMSGEISYVKGNKINDDDTDTED